MRSPKPDLPPCRIAGVLRANTVVVHGVESAQDGLPSDESKAYEREEADTDDSRLQQQDLPCLWQEVVFTRWYSSPMCDDAGRCVPQVAPCCREEGTRKGSKRLNPLDGI